MSGETRSVDNTYSRAIVSYVDLLGFGQLIRDSRKNPTQIAKILNLLIKLKAAAGTGGLIHRKEDGKPEEIFYSFNFSDLTVRCTLVPDDA
jgi:hypothetical protein